MAGEPTTCIREWDAIYADFEPRHPPAGWQAHGKHIRHVLKCGFSGLIFRWQVSDDGEQWTDWLAS